MVNSPSPLLEPILFFGVLSLVIITSFLKEIRDGPSPLSYDFSISLPSQVLPQGLSLVSLHLILLSYKR